MEQLISIQKKGRIHLANFLDNYSLNQITTIPKGFNNNLFWNIAHTVATQQLVCYYLSNVPMNIDKFWIDNFKKGTVPSLKIEKDHVVDLKEILIKQPNDILIDYTNGMFKSYKTYETSYGATLNSIEEAIKFNNIHEALHLGYIMAMCKLV